MTDRTATDTIKGYFYQFDLTILKLLKLKDDNDGITVEGIEDIDIKNATIETAIQCKYHSKTEYNHSVIAKPIRLMLNHYKEVLESKQRRIKYLYFGHFKSGHEKLSIPITLDFLKSNLLTYKKNKVEYEHHKDLKLSDTELLLFINVLEVDIYAQSYEEQLTEIFDSLMNQAEFKCDDFEAENFYYNNALKVISNLAKKEDLIDRKISKKTFIEEINFKQVLFNKWFIQFKSKKNLHSDLRSQYFTSYNISPFERFFLTEVTSSNSRSEIKDVIHTISKKWSDIRSKINPSTYCPYVYIYGISDQELIELKTELVGENFKFSDGFDFNGATFSPKSITEKATFHNQIRIKIIDDLNSLKIVLNEISKTKEVYQFYSNSPYFSISNESIKHIQIQVEDINDIKNII
ncbi:MAG: hypothetical protein ACJASM_002718 [Salibacteraceae bacterium]|jgi:hypothetical protein